MKILCLHGYGTTGAIFEQQLSGIMAGLGSSHEWVFLDGEVHVAKSGMFSLIIASCHGLLMVCLELTDFAAGPHLAFYEGILAQPVKEAHDLLTTIIAEEGPFDGVMGFSQGASLAISYLIQHQIDNPDQPPPFRFAVLFSCGFVLSPDPDYKHDEIMSFLKKLTPADLDTLHKTLVYKRHMMSVNALEGLEKLNERERTLISQLFGTAASVLDTRQTLAIDDYNPLLNGTMPDKIEPRVFPRFFHPVYTEQKVAIPTVHVMGSCDAPAIRRLGILAQGLCSKGEVTGIEHDGSHEIPRKPNDVRAIVSAIEKANYQGYTNQYGLSANL